MLELGTKTYAAKKMLGNLTNVPTDMLQDMAFAILQAGRLLTSDEISELERSKVSYSIVLFVPTIRIRIK
jgi:hypothetical protein